MEDAWYRLDNSGALYPMLQTLTFQSLFRVGVTLTEPVRPEVLTEAVKDALSRYPGFRVTLRTGFFRYFFDYNPDLPVVSPDTGALFRKIDFRKNNRYLFRLTYFDKRISMDFWHCLTDGSGAMEFLKTVVFAYLTRIHGALPEDGTVRLPYDKPKEEEYEDAFLRYFRSFKLFDGIGKMTEGKVYAIRGKTFKRQGYGLIEGRLKTSELIRLAHENDASMTELLVALIMLSITKVYGTELLNAKNNDLVAMVPVNLRNIFPSDTLRNFVMMAKTRLTPNETPNTLKDFVAVIKSEMRAQRDKEVLLDKISFTSLIDKLWILKILPQAVKTFFTKFGKSFSFNPQQTFIMSNLGRVKMPEGCEKYIRDFHFYVNCNSKSPENVAAVSYGETTVVSFTRFLKSTEIDRAFFTTLSELGLHVEVTGNYRELYQRRLLHALPKM